MDEMKSLLAKRAAAMTAGAETRRKWSHSPAHELADEISRAFGEPKRFGMYLGTINRVGADRARAIFRELSLEGKGDLRKLFFWKCRTEQVTARPMDKNKKLEDRKQKTDDRQG